MDVMIKVKIKGYDYNVGFVSLNKFTIESDCVTPITAMPKILKSWGNAHSTFLKKYEIVVFVAKSVKTLDRYELYELTTYKIELDKIVKVYELGRYIRHGSKWMFEGKYTEC